MFNAGTGKSLKIAGWELKEGIKCRKCKDVLAS